MAYIPDDCIDDAADLSAPAFLLFVHLCRRRNHRTGTAFINCERMQAILGVSRSSLYRSMAELSKNGWIERSGPKITITRGNFDPVDKRYAASQIWDDTSRKSGQQIPPSGIASKDVPASYTKPIEPAVIPGSGHQLISNELKRWNEATCKRCFDVGFLTYPNGKVEFCDLCRRAEKFPAAITQS